jgi:hypothetical protein
LQNERIFSAPSLAEVIKQLLIYRPTGVLTIWHAGGLRQEDTRITIEQGRLLHVFWGSYMENANETVLGWINSWGTIHFSFLATESHLQLPAPAQTARQEQPLMQQVPPRQRPAVTQPLQPLSSMTRPPDYSSLKAANQQGKPLFDTEGQTQGLAGLRRQEERSNDVTNNDPLIARAHETVIVSLTSYGRDYPASYLPRHDRTIFLLVNGRRTLVDLSQLTKRSLEEVYNTLYRLQDLQLLTIEGQPKRSDRLNE